MISKLFKSLKLFQINVRGSFLQLVNIFQRVQCRWNDFRRGYMWNKNTEIIL